MLRPFQWCLLACLCLWPGVGGQGRFSSCYKGDSDCPPCPDNRTHSWTSTIFLDILDGGLQMVEGVREAQEVIGSYGEGQSIVELRPLLFLHTTLNYFCCHTAQEKEKVVDILRSYRWSAVNLNYSNVSCNLDHDNTTIYLLAIPDGRSQDELFHWVRGVERKMEEEGIPVINPRRQPFHCTMALVTHSYPVDTVTSVLQQKIRHFSTVTFSQFFVDGHWVTPKGLL